MIISSYTRCLITSGTEAGSSKPAVSLFVCVCGGGHLVSLWCSSVYTGDFETVNSSENLTHVIYELMYDRMI